VKLDVARDACSEEGGRPWLLLSGRIFDVWSHFHTSAAIPSGAEQGYFFYMLHCPDHARVKMPLYCPQCQRIIERSEIVKGYEYSKGEYVIVEPSELKKIEPRTATGMEILEFVKADEIDPVFVDSSSYLMPEEAGRRVSTRCCPRRSRRPNSSRLQSSPCITASTR
jgi:hypothetical protein